MSWLALAYALATSHAEPTSSPTPSWTTWTSTGRLVDGQVHVGLRPAFFCDPEGDNGSVEYGVGATLQVTADLL